MGDAKRARPIERKNNIFLYLRWMNSNAETHQRKEKAIKSKEKSESEQGLKRKG